jgi:hypothetical protein
MKVISSTCPKIVRNMDERTRVGETFTEAFPQGEVRGSCGVQDGNQQATFRNAVMVFCQMRSEKYGVEVYTAGYLDFLKTSGKVRASITQLPPIAGQSSCETEMDVKINF